MWMNVLVVDKISTLGCRAVVEKRYAIQVKMVPTSDFAVILAVALAFYSFLFLVYLEQQGMSY